MMRAWPEVTEVEAAVLLQKHRPLVNERQVIFREEVPGKHAIGGATVSRGASGTWGSVA